MSNELVQTNQLILSHDYLTDLVVCIGRETLGKLVCEFDREITQFQEHQVDGARRDYFEDFPFNYHPVLSNGILKKCVKVYHFDSEFDVYIIQL